jgi:hypothetical protein
MYIFTRTKQKKHNRRKSARYRAAAKAKNDKRRATLLK